MLVGIAAQAAVGSYHTSIRPTVILIEVRGVDHKTVVQATESRKTKANLILQTAALIVSIKREVAPLLGKNTTQILMVAVVF